MGLGSSSHMGCRYRFEVRLVVGVRVSRGSCSALGDCVKQQIEQYMKHRINVSGWSMAAAIIASCSVLASATARTDDHAHDDHAMPATHKDEHAAKQAMQATPVAKPAKDDKANPFKAGNRKTPTKAAAMNDAPVAMHETKMEAKSAMKVEGGMAVASQAAMKPAAGNAGATLTEPGAVLPDEALTLLMEGNERWAAGTSVHPAVDSARRAALAAEGQRPFVTILTCADSRIPVERVFDRGVGEIFAIRVAGNVSGKSETGTIEYGLGHLKTRLLVVMGHTKCGAVAAAASKAELHGAVGELVDSIQPAVVRAQRQHPELDATAITPYAIKENIWQSVFGLLKSDEIRELVSKGDVKVVGAVYDIASGKVEWLGEHPWQGELITALENRKAADAMANANSGEAPAMQQSEMASQDEHR